MYSIVTTTYFLRRARKFLRKHPEMEERVAKVIDDLRENPFAPHLVFHHLSGPLENAQTVRLTYDYRIVLTVAVTEKEIILLDIGSHDEVYR